MKLLIGLTGFALGAVVVIAGLLFNPLSPKAVLTGSAASTYATSILEFHGVELDEVALLGLPLQTAGNPQPAQSLAASNATVMVLRGSGGEAIGLATRLVTLDEESDLLRGELGTETYTNIFFPNRGSVLLNGHEDRWAVVRSNVMRMLGQPAESTWSVTTRRRDGRPSGFAGGSGIFEGVGGRYTETLQPSAAGDGTFESQISLELSAPQ